LIRDATPEDNESIRRVQAESWLAAYPNDEVGISHDWIRGITDTWLTPEALTASEQRMVGQVSDPDGINIVALSDDEIIGFSSATRRHPAHGDADIFAIYLRPDMFGTGAGQALMTETLNLIGDTYVRLDVASYNGRAIRFYKRNGFNIVPNSEQLYPTGPNGKIPPLIIGKNAIPTIDMIRHKIHSA